MTDHDVQLLLFDLALIIVLARLFGVAAKRIGQPPVLGEIVAGILLGPTIWGVQNTTVLFPVTVRPPLTAIADIGLVLFMFVVGYEVDLALVAGREKMAAGVAIGSIVAPLALGVGLGAWLAHEHHLTHAATFMLFFGTAMSITAFPVLARILTDRGLHRTRVGGLALASASIDDVLAWALLAVVVAIAGASTGSGGLRILLAPVYAAAMIWMVRPLLRRIADIYNRQGRLTPNVLAVVLALLLLSSYATDWMGVKFIFGAFIFGIVMPRSAPALREDILQRLEQVSVLLLLPVFFVIAGLSVNLRGLGLSGLADLGLIMLVAVAGKFGGAYYGARLTGVKPRQAGALASLMNTRGLTEIVILTVGLQLGILNTSLYSLMVVMAIVTTAMAGPLLRVIYPTPVMERDIAEADRAMLGKGAAHRIAAVIDQPEAAEPLVDVAVQLTASRPNSELMLVHLVSQQPGGRLEVGAGLGGDLLAMTQAMAMLHELAARAAERGVPCVVHSRFSDDVTKELPAFVAAAGPTTVVLGPASGQLADQLGDSGTTQIVTALRPLPPTPAAVLVRWARGSDGAAAVQVGAQLATTSGLPLVLAPGGRATSALAADLTRRGIATTAGTVSADVIVVAPADRTGAGRARQGWAGREDQGGAHLAVLAGSVEASEEVALWAATLNGSRAQDNALRQESDQRQTVLQRADGQRAGQAAQEQQAGEQQAGEQAAQQESRQP